MYCASGLSISHCSRKAFCLAQSSAVASGIFTPSATFKYETRCAVDPAHKKITFRATHWPNIIIIRFMHWSISAAFITAVIIRWHYLAPIKAQVWQSLPRNCQLPHCVHLDMLLSGMPIASAIFLTPTHPQSMHWYALNPSGMSNWSSHKNSVLRLHPLHLNCGWLMVISLLPTVALSTN